MYPLYTDKLRIIIFSKWQRTTSVTMLFGLFDFTNPIWCIISWLICKQFFNGGCVAHDRPLYCHFYFCIQKEGLSLIPCAFCHVDVSAALVPCPIIHVVLSEAGLWPCVIHHRGKSVLCPGCGWVWRTGWARRGTYDPRTPSQTPNNVFSWPTSPSASSAVQCPAALKKKIIENMNKYQFMVKSLLF